MRVATASTVDRRGLYANCIGLAAAFRFGRTVSTVFSIVIKPLPAILSLFPPKMYGKRLNKCGKRLNHDGKYCRKKMIRLL
jgi:hypothetical protein